MRHRNWWLILIPAVALGFALFRFWGAVLAPFAALACFGWLDSRGESARKAQANENARLAAFIEAQAKSSTIPAASPKLTAAAAPPVAQTMRAPVRPAALSRQDAVNRALRLALDANDLPLAVALARDWSADIDAIRLEAAQFDRLAGAALEHGEFFVAGRLHETAARAAGDEALAQKRLLEAAAKSSQAGAREAARELYRALLARYPQSPYANFARGGLERIEADPAKITSMGTSDPG